MGTRIRLKRMGTKKKPFYRVVVADSRTPRDGRSIDEIGIYDPNVDPPRVEIDQEKASHWIGEGALLTDTVKSLFKRAGIKHGP